MQFRLGLVALLAMGAAAEVFAQGGAGQGLGRVDKIEVAHSAARTWVLVSVTGMIDIASQRIENPPRVFVDFQGTVPAKGIGVFRQGMEVIEIKDPYVRQIRIAENQKGVTRVVLDLVREDVLFRTEVQAGNKLAIEVSLKEATLENPLRRENFQSRDSLQSKSVPPRPEKALTPVVARPRPAERPKFFARSPFEFPPPPILAGRAPLPVVDARVMPYFATGFLFRDFRPLRPDSSVVARPNATPAPVATSTAPPQVAKAAATAPNMRSLTRVLGLKVGRVVIDAGHGGHDVGSTGKSGMLEKDLTLDLAKRVGEYLTENLGCEVIYTREDDRYIPLEERTAFANRMHADLFISIHANSSRVATATGVETYYLNFTSSPEALEVAARENAVSERSVGDLGDLVKKIALKDKLDESREFAGKVHSSLVSASAKLSAKGNDRGVRKAPFVVLIGAHMPSILVEVGFLSNPKEEALLKTDAYRDKLAKALAKGVAQYAGTLSHFQMAERPAATRPPAAAKAVAGQD